MRFKVNIRPKAKGRPRFVRRGNFVSTYTPKTTVEYEETIRNAFLEQCKGLYDKEYDGLVKVFIVAYFKPSKSLSKKKQEELIGKPHLKKPDLDNIGKAIIDALNGVAWKDDNQVYELHMHKCYGQGDLIEVEIEYE